MTPEQILAWENLIGLSIALGVKSFQAIASLMRDAGVDDDTIATFEPKWTDLYIDVARAAAGD